MADTIHYINTVPLDHKRVLLRVDFNVSLDQNNSIADDARIRQSLPTIKYLLEHQNKLILVSHLGRPKNRDPKYSLQIVANKLQEYLPEYSVKLIPDFLTDADGITSTDDNKTIYMLENIRYYPEEKKGDEAFAKKLAALADVYVDDAFGVCHRADASVVAITHFLPSYGGLLLKKEINMISKAIDNPEKPFVAIIGGAKISTKIELISKLICIADYLLIGGGMANTFLAAKGYPIGESYYEADQVETAKKILEEVATKNTKLMLPSDVLTGNGDDMKTGGELYKVKDVPAHRKILDIGPETQAQWGYIIMKAKTIVWNGPVGLFENPIYRCGTDFVYYAITHNEDCTSIVGGGDTLSAISKKEYLDKITHISTGGGAMLEFIEKGTLPGIEALEKAST